MEYGSSRSTKAFLYGVIDEEIYMKISEGLEEYMSTGFGGDECLILDKEI